MYGLFKVAVENFQLNARTFVRIYMQRVNPNSHLTRCLINYSLFIPQRIVC